MTSENRKITEQGHQREVIIVPWIDYAFRASRWRGKILGYCRAIPWWMVSIALHIAAVLILSKMVFVTKRDDCDISIIVCPHAADPIRIDLQKIHAVFESLNKAQSQTVEHDFPLIPQPTLEVAEAATVDPTEGVTMVDDTTPTDSSFTGLGNGQGDSEGDAIGDGIGTGERDASDVMGIDEGAVVSRGGSYKGIMNHLTYQLVRQARNKQYRGNVLLIWLIDASLSMKDDQQAIKERLWEMDRKFREQEGAGDLKQAVIYYSDKPHLWVEPTSDVDQVMKSIDAIELSPPGTVENTMAAIVFAANHYGQSTQKAKKVIVLVDDDSPDDSHLLENALLELRKAKINLIVINRECPFQSEILYEGYSYVDTDGDEYTGTGFVRRGPETAYPEVTSIAWGGFFDRGQVLSGFGIYDISRLAYYTGGKYYILDPMPQAEKEAMYDWNLMELYSPELVSRQDYQKRTSRNPFKATIESVTRSWNSGCPVWHWVQWQDAHSQLQACKNKLGQVDHLIREMENKAIMPTSQIEKLKENRRWPANADLVMASLVLARHRVRQFKYGLEEFMRETRSVPPNHVVTFHACQPVKDTPEEAKDRAEVIQAMRFVADRHPRTPWGKVAATFNPDSDQYLYGFKFFHQYYFPPYCATIEMTDGRVVEAYVTDERENTISFTVSKRGTITLSKKRIKGLNRKPCASGYGGDPDRI